MGLDIFSRNTSERVKTGRGRLCSLSAFLMIRSDLFIADVNSYDTTSLFKLKNEPCVSMCF